ncbi:hypothetical protein EYF80_066122 [Liparis tanakae]|uniref:Uncharacterized protein n=1 Tax=Liparis tanakae TaxID=230148 RepID=A0A4Z2E4B2_9TELE|nr:hypothetical protein EYF80_066122 [Liparis tanakae]
MLLLLLLLCCSPTALGQLVEPRFEDELADFDLDLAPRRVPRQVRTILSQVRTPHGEEAVT